jgi:hypothetical protein
MRALTFPAGIAVPLLLPVLVVFTLCSSSGCLSSSTVLTARGLDGSPVKLDREELNRLADSIEVELQELASSETVRTTVEDRRHEKESPGLDDHVLAEFVTGDPPVKILLVEQDDRTPAAFVYAQGGWPLSEPYARSYVEAVKHAFAEVLPQCEVVVERSAGLDLR